MHRSSLSRGPIHLKVIINYIANVVKLVVKVEYVRQLS